MCNYIIHVCMSILFNAHLISSIAQYCAILCYTYSLPSPDIIQHMYIHIGVNPKSETQTTFLAWQTWDLIRLTIEGFTGLCSDFLARNPRHFIKPCRVNGSVIESLFGRFKYNAGGHLSSVNYRGCVAKLIIADAVNSRESYKGEQCNHQGALIKKTYKRK